MSGGLGNQLFIWQYAHLLAKTSGFCVYLVDYYDKYDSRKCEMYPISLNCKHKIRIIKPWKVLNPFKVNDFLKSRSKLRPLACFFSRLIHDCQAPNEIPKSIELKDKLFVRGYFQNCASALNGLKFTEAEILSYVEQIYRGQNIEVITPAQQVLHLRRGDFSENSSTLGVLTERYFMEHVDWEIPYIIHTDEKELPNSEFFKKAVKIYGANNSPWVVIAHALLAENFVGSNSTLSWWAVALNRVNHASLKLPKPWYLMGSKFEDDLHLEKATYVTAQFREPTQC
jgi:hypothetical protein